VNVLTVRATVGMMVCGHVGLVLLEGAGGLGRQMLVVMVIGCCCSGMVLTVVLFVCYVFIITLRIASIINLFLTV